MDDLWRGGPWEQPAPNFTAPPAVRVPRPELYRSRRRLSRRRWAVFGATVLLILCLTIALMVLQATNRTRGHAWPDEFPDFTAGPAAHETAIPQAATGTGVTVSLSPPSGEALDYIQVYEQNARSIVAIYAFDRLGMGEGTGIVLTEDGYIITNAHVVEGASSAVVLLDDDTWFQADLVGENADEDLAVLKIDAQGLTPARFGDSDLLRVGEQVSALGNPMGYRLSMTPGIISALDREIAVDGITMYLLQTSAAINYGNSGGALFNDRGQVVGVTTVKIIDSEGSAEALGFAIPSRRVKYVVDRLIAGQEIKSPALGITVRQERDVYGLRVVEIQPWSDAVGQDLRPGDLIVAANGIPVTTNRGLARIKDLMDVGDSLELTIDRDGRELTVALLLADAAEHPDGAGNAYGKIQKSG